MYEDDERKNEYTGEYGRDKYSYEDDYLNYVRNLKDEELEELESVEFRDVPRERKVRKKRHPFRIVLIVIIIAAALFGVMMSPLCNVKEIKVKGCSYYTEEQIIGMSRAKTGVNLFRSVSASDIKERLGGNAYFESVSVYKLMPGTLMIKVKERKQKSALVYGGNYVVLDDEGRVLRVAEEDPEVTLIQGFTIKKMNSGNIVEVEEENLFTNTMELLKIVEEGNLYFKRIVVGGSSVSAFINNTFVVRANMSLLKSSIENGDLQKVIGKLYEEEIKHGTITISENNYMSFSPNIN